MCYKRSQLASGGSHTAYAVLHSQFQRTEGRRREGGKKQGGNRMWQPNNHECFHYPPNNDINYVTGAESHTRLHVILMTIVGDGALQRPMHHRGSLTPSCQLSSASGGAPAWRRGRPTGHCSRPSPQPRSWVGGPSAVRPALPSLRQHCFLLCPIVNRALIKFSSIPLFWAYHLSLARTSVPIRICTIGK